MTPSRPLLAAVVLLSLSGCFLQQMLRAGQPETWLPVEKLLEEKKYPEASAELRRLAAELQPAMRRQDTAELTPFARQLKRLGHEGVLDVAINAREVMNGSKATRVEALASARRGLEALSWVDGFPMDALRDQLLTLDRLAELRAEFQAVVGKLAGISERHVALLEENEAAGLTAVALYGWLRFLPEGPAQEALRGRKIHALSQGLARASGGKYALALGKGAPAAYAGYLQDGERRALGSVRNASFTAPGEADAVLTVTGTAPQVKRSSKNVQAEWEYPTGQKEVDNPKYRTYQDRVRDAEKAAARYKQAYDSAVCPKSGSPKSRVKAPAGTCADAPYQGWKREEKTAEGYRGRLRNTSPRTTVTVFSQHPYTAREDAAEAEAVLTFDITFAKGQPARQLKLVANVTQKAYTRAAVPAVQMPALAEKPAPDAELLGALADEAAQQVARAVAAARDGLLVDLDKGLADATAKGDALQKAEWTLRLAAVKGSGYLGGVARAVEEQLGEGLSAAPELEALLQPGTAALRHERWAGFAQAELEAGRHASALSAWAFIGAMAEGELEARRAAGLERARQGLSAGRALALSSTGTGAVGGGVAAALAEQAGRLAGFQPVAGAVPLRVTVAAAAPRISKTAGELTLEQEVSEEAASEDEAPPAPEKVPYKARRDAATLEGTVSVQAELAGKGYTFELPVTHVVEAFSHPARPATGLDARSEALPGDAALEKAWTRQAGVAALGRLMELVHAPAGEGAGPALNAGLLQVLRQKPVSEPLSAEPLLPVFERAFGPVNRAQVEAVLSAMAQ